MTPEEEQDRRARHQMLADHETRIKTLEEKLSPPSEAAPTDGGEPAEDDASGEASGDESKPKGSKKGKK